MPTGMPLCVVLYRLSPTAVPVKVMGNFGTPAFTPTGVPLAVITCNATLSCEPRQTKKLFLEGPQAAGEYAVTPMSSEIRALAGVILIIEAETKSTSADVGYCNYR
jgi:hypothetical protein